MDPIKPNQNPIQPNDVQNNQTHPLQNQENLNPGVQDPNSLESFIRQGSSAQVEEKESKQGKNFEPKFVERIVYKKQKVHGFFRTLTILALVVIGFLMLLESLNIFFLNIGGFELSLFYPIFVIFSSIVIWSYRGLFGKIFGLLLFLVVVVGFFAIGVYSGLNPSTDTKFGYYISYPSLADTQYSKLYLNTLITDLTFIGKKTDNFLEGNYGSDKKLIIFSGAKDNYQYYSIKEEKNLNLLQSYYSVLSLGVTSKEPLYLYIKNLLALQKVDFSNTLASIVKIHAGGLISDIVIGESVKTLDVEAALADIIIHLPKDVGVRLTYKHFIGQLELNDFEQKSKGYFESVNIDNVDKIIDITMRFGAARTKIVWDK